MASPVLTMSSIFMLFGLLCFLPGASTMDVATLFDGKYVDTATEGTHIANSVSSGADLSAVTYSSLSDWVSALSSSQAALVPDFDKGYIQSDLTASQISAISGFVENGGILVTATDSYRRNHYFLNKVFGWSIARKSNYYSSYNPPRQAAAEGTCFAEDQGSPATLQYQYYSTTFSDSISLPTGSIALYSDGSRQVSVWSVEIGAGKVYMLAYDWRSGSNADWDWVLQTALSCGVSGTPAPQTTLPPSTPPPGCSWVELGEFSGSSLPSPVTAASGPVTMALTSDANTAADGEGFLAVYGPNLNTALAASTCEDSPATLENVYGVISDGDGFYANNADCTWIIAPEGASTVSLVFESFSLENYYDKLRIYECEDKECLDKTELADSPFTGTTIPAAQTSTTKYMQVVLDTDSSVTREGFRLLYAGSQLSLSQSITYCTDDATTLSENVGFISTDSSYSASEECEWKFPIVGEQGLSITFLEFETEQGADFVRVNGLECSSSTTTTSESKQTDPTTTVSESQSSSIASSSSTTTAATDRAESTPAPPATATNPSQPSSSSSVTPPATDASTSSSPEPDSEPTTTSTSDEQTTSSTAAAEEHTTSSESASTTSSSGELSSTAAVAANSTSPVTSPIESSAPFHTTTPALPSVATLMDPSLVNTNDGSKMVQSLSADAIFTATAYTSVAEWVAALPSSGAALVPELVTASPLTTTQAAAVLEFVESGGTLVSASDDQGSNHNFLNRIFGWTTDNRYWSMGEWEGGLRMPGAEGTCFGSDKGSPAMLSGETYITYSDERDLPAGANILYSDGGVYSQVSVWGMEVGAGNVYMLAYDWNSGAQESWDWVLHAAITCGSEAATTTTTAAATTSTTAAAVTTTTAAAAVPQTTTTEAASNSAAPIETSAAFETTDRPTTSAPSPNATAASHIESTAPFSSPLPTRRRRTLALASPAVADIPLPVVSVVTVANSGSAPPSGANLHSNFPTSTTLCLAGLAVVVLAVSTRRRTKAVSDSESDRLPPRALRAEACLAAVTVVVEGEAHVEHACPPEPLRLAQDPRHGATLDTAA